MARCGRLGNTMVAKTIYVVGGTNGVGKSTIRKDLLDASVPYINADFIAKEMKGGQTSLMLAELAREYGSNQMKKYIGSGESFAFENNLHEKKTFEWLQKSLAEHNGELVYFEIASNVVEGSLWGKDLRSDPRYIEFIKSIQASRSATD